jgi:Chitobiase/beta-hexosaminidase C-terminal domain
MSALLGALCTDGCHARYHATTPRRNRQLYSAAGNSADEATEPVTVQSTLDGSRPTYQSPMVSSAGLREGAAPIELAPGRTTVHWFSVDAAGNVENRYDPDGHGRSYRRQVVRVG